MGKAWSNHGGTRRPARDRACGLGFYTARVERSKDCTIRAHWRIHPPQDAWRCRDRFLGQSADRAASLMGSLWSGYLQFGSECCHAVAASTLG